MIVSFGHKDKDVSKHRPVAAVAMQLLCWHTRFHTHRYDPDTGPLALKRENEALQEPTQIIRVILADEHFWGRLQQGTLQFMQVKANNSPPPLAAPHTPPKKKEEKKKKKKKKKQTKQQKQQKLKTKNNNPSTTK